MYGARATGTGLSLWRYIYIQTHIHTYVHTCTIAECMGAEQQEQACLCGFFHGSKWWRHTATHSDMQHRYVRACVCMRVCMYVHVQGIKWWCHTATHSDMQHRYAFPPLCVCVCVCVYMCMSSERTDDRVHVTSQPPLYMWTYAWMYICMYICMSSGRTDDIVHVIPHPISMGSCDFTYIHTYIHTYINTHIYNRSARRMGRRYRHRTIFRRFCGFWDIHTDTYIHTYIQQVSQGNGLTLSASHHISTVLWLLRHPWMGCLTDMHILWMWILLMAL
jgi:hypothetical protein